MEPKTENIADSPDHEQKQGSIIKRKSFQTPENVLKIETVVNQKKLLTIRPDKNSPNCNLSSDNVINNNHNVSITNSNLSCAQHMEESKFVDALVTNLLGNVIDHNCDESISKEISSSIANDQVTPVIGIEQQDDRDEKVDNNQNVYNTTKLKTTELEDNMLIEKHDENPMHSIIPPEKDEIIDQTPQNPCKTFDNHANDKEFQSIFNVASNPESKPEEKIIINGDIPQFPANENDVVSNEPPSFQPIDQTDDNNELENSQDDQKVQLHIDMINKEFQEESDYQEIRIDESDNEPMSKNASNNEESNFYQTDRDANLVAKSDNNENENQSLVYENIPVNKDHEEKPQI